jgi:GxxExxY protein
MSKNWFMIQKKSSVYRRELEEYLGEIEDDLTVNKYGQEMYKMIEEICKKVYEEKGRGELECVYRGALGEELCMRGYCVREDKNMRSAQESNVVYRIDLYAERCEERFVIEVKSRQLNRGFKQLVEYLLELEVSDGYLVGFTGDKVKVYEMVQENGEVYLWDGRVVRKINVREKMICANAEQLEG